MQLPDNYILVRKEVKHARVRVNETGIVRIIAPTVFSDLDIENLIQKKQRWIDKNMKFFRQMAKINLQRNQLLLYGNRYNYFYDSTFAHKVVINHEFKTILAKRDLLEISVQEKWYRDVAKKHLTNRLTELSEKLNFAYKKLYIRNQKRKWGNCSKNQNISLNWRLIKAPVFVIDYIIVHELIHTVVMNHSHKFWTLLKSHYPDYRQAIDWLDKYGNNL
ncbi:MAG: M48 family metallopeptidase [Draconibacterium sp.]